MKKKNNESYIIRTDVPFYKYRLNLCDPKNVPFKYKPIHITQNVFLMIHVKKL